MPTPLKHLATRPNVCSPTTRHRMLCIAWRTFRKLCRVILLPPLQRRSSPRLSTHPARKLPGPCFPPPLPAALRTPCHLQTQLLPESSPHWKIRRHPSPPHAHRPHEHPHTARTLPSSL